MTTRSTAEAVKSTLLGGLLYIPVSLVFVYIGTALFSYYVAQPELLPTGTPSDQVFPWFIVHGLPTGLTGLIIASLFSRPFELPYHPAAASTPQVPLSS